MNRLSRAAAAILAALALACFTAIPALASGTPDPNPVQVSASVNQTLTITGLSGTIAFTNVVPGTPQTITNAEQYTVSTNAPNGYTLDIAQPSGGLQTAGGGNSLPDSDLCVQETARQASSGCVPFSDTATNTMLIDQTNGPSTNSYAENWGINPPATLAAGTYSGTFNYVITAN